MLSQKFVQQACLLGNKSRRILHKYKLGNAFATEVAVKPAISNDKSYVDTINEEWENAESFQKIPRITKFQLIRGFMKGGEFSGMSLNDVFLTCRKRYGDTFILPGLFGHKLWVVLFNTDDFEKVFRTEGSYPSRPGGDPMIYYRSKRKDGFFNEHMGLMSKGEKWWEFRHAVNPVLMQPRNAKLYLEPMQKVNEEFIQRIRDIRDPKTMEVPENFIDDINHLTFESVAVVALDKQFGLIRQNPDSPEAYELSKNIQYFLKAMYDLGIKPNLYKYITTPTYKRFENAMDTIFNITSKYINEALERLAVNVTDGQEKSVLEKLLKIDRKIAIVMAMDMLMAGIDTTTSVITGQLLCLAKNPEVQQKLRQEILNHLSKKTDQFTIENMKHLPYLRACIKEGLRLYPISPGNFRETGMDIVLSGYRIPKGTQVAMNSNLMLSEERFFPNANKYIPERWLRSTDQSYEQMRIDNINPFLYLPFGFGPRSCVGKRIVDLELEITLANLVRNFNIRFNYPTDNAFKTHFISTPAIPLKFEFADIKY